jgi:hypothetical protein
MLVAIMIIWGVLAVAGIWFNHRLWKKVKEFEKGIDL